ncbi:hypothetical protein M433DRAFT_130558 [Acidomyces richmondensis BFW]|nr:MAG: hypothetical protein FE78DRAFT_71638 [Acidomyces sp. 'richmondensis']KYG50216.1 hypothetical protein M433DRAFT_130558 [Acidomyces richmondensis BFW]
MSSPQDLHDFEIVPSPSDRSFISPTRPPVNIRASTSFQPQAPATSLSPQHDAVTSLPQAIAKILLFSTIPFSVAVAVVAAYATETNISNSNLQITQTPSAPLREPLDAEDVNIKRTNAKGTADVDSPTSSPSDPPLSNEDDDFLTLAAARAGDTIRAYRRPLQWIDEEIPCWLTT